MAQAKHKTTRIPDWVRAMRQTIHGSKGTRWSVREIRGKAQLTLRYDDGARSSIVTTEAWAGPSSFAIQSLVDRLDPMVLEQHLPLKEAYRRVIGATATARGGADWPGLIEAFRSHKLDSGAVSERTWVRMYRPALQLAIEVLGGRPAPKDGKSLLAAIAKRQGLPPGARGRQIFLQYVAGLLRYSVEEQGLDHRWQPPASIGTLVGKSLEQREYTAPIKDGELISLRVGIADPRLRLAVGLAGVFGLRPWEIWACRAGGGRLQVLRGKRTSAGIGKTRSITGIDPVGWPGLAAELLAMLEERGAGGLPPKPEPGREGHTLWKALRREPAWLNLLEAAAADGRRLKPYSLRHGYALRGSSLGISIRTLANQLGHGVPVFSQIYGQWTDAETVDQEIARAVARQAVAPAMA